MKYSALWHRRFAVACAGAFLSLIAFDLLWCASTNFRPMGFTSTYTSAFALALLMALPALTCRRRWPMLLCLLVADALLEANLMYCRTYFEAIPPASYLLASNVAQFGDSITASLRWTDLSLPVIAVATALFMGPREVKLRAVWKPYVLTFGIAAAATAIFGAFHGGIARHITACKNECYMHAFPPVLYTLPVAFAADLAEAVTPVSEADVAYASSVVDRRLAESLPMDSVSLGATKNNLVFIFVESLEGWPIGKSVEGQEITPNINRWLADSLAWVATRVRSQVGTGRSIDGQLMMSTGLYPTTNYVYSMRYAASEYPSLAKEMRRARGAHSYLLSGDRANTWNQSVAAAAFGIETPMYRDSWDCSEYFGKPRNPTDKSLFRQIEQRMRSGEIWPEGENALVEIVTYSSHFPFRIAPEARAITLTDDYPATLGDYIQALNYTDGALGQLVDYLRTRSDWPETMVVIVGDHEGLAADRATIAAARPDLVDAGQHIPMIVLGGPARGLYDGELNQPDVYSTTLHLMGIDPVWPGMGTSAFAPADTIPDAPRASAAIIAANLLKGKLNY